jgi:predicted  nucleic acid-binding Zn-ribbon protein
VKRYRGLQAENQRLRRELDESLRKVDALDGQVLELNQRRQDVGKRMDELISQLDHLDAHFSASNDA